MQGIQYKAVSVSGVSKVKDEGNGVVTAYVSVTGIKDNVNDIILPGAYTKTLRNRKPKGVWSHDWKTPTARTLDATELAPGHKDLPKSLANGQSWPKEAGALRIKMQFNLKTQRGREAHSDVLFFGDQQEWSIGYAVPPGGSEKKDGVRHIKELEMYEYSPVLWGAMPHARTANGVGVKDAQMAFKAMDSALRGEPFDLAGFEAKYLQFKDSIDGAGEGSADGDDQDGEDFEGDEVDDDVDDDADDTDDDEYDEEDEEDEEDDDDDEDEDDDEKSFDPTEVRAAILGLEADAEMMEVGFKAYIEAKATQHETVLDAVSDVDDEVDDFDGLQDDAEAFDNAMVEGDPDAAADAATAVLDRIEASIQEAEEDGKSADSLCVVSRVIADQLEAFALGGDYGEKEDAFELEGTEFKLFTGEGTTREYGVVLGEDDLEAKGDEAVAAFIDALDGEDLLAMTYYMQQEQKENEPLLEMTAEAIETRLEIGDIDVKRVVRSAAGARRFGVPIGSVIGGHGGGGNASSARTRGTSRVGPGKPSDSGKSGAHLHRSIVNGRPENLPTHLGKLSDAELSAVQEHNRSKMTGGHHPKFTRLHTAITDEKNSRRSKAGHATRKGGGKYDLAALKKMKVGEQSAAIKKLSDEDLRALHSESRAHLRSPKINHSTRTNTVLENIHYGAAEEFRRRGLTALKPGVAKPAAKKTTSGGIPRGSTTVKRVSATYQGLLHRVGGTGGAVRKSVQGLSDADFAAMQEHHTSKKPKRPPAHDVAGRIKLQKWQGMNTLIANERRRRGGAGAKEEYVTLDTKDLGIEDAAGFLDELQALTAE